MKKKRNIMLSLVICVLSISIIFIAVNTDGQKPFRTLTKEDIKEATVELYPPNITEELDEKEIESLVKILKKVVIYDEDNTYTEYAGQAVIYKITKKDGSVIKIQAYNPFLIIDGTGYKTKYEPCEELNALGNKIGDTEYSRQD